MIFYKIKIAINDQIKIIGNKIRNVGKKLKG